ncbi:MAG: energy transducer TonB, partial [Bacteroidota bacterium]
KGNGVESFLDSITGKKITYEYENKMLKRVYFIDSNGEKIYQLCENNAEIKKLKNLQKTLNDKLSYPLESIEKGTHGNILVKCVIEPSGLVSGISLVKGLDTDCNNALWEFLSCFKVENYWNPGKVDGKPVKQEIIFPIDFSINNESSSYRNNYFWFPNMMMQQQMMMQQMRIPMGRF